MDSTYNHYSTKLISTCTSHWIFLISFLILAVNAYWFWQTEVDDALIYARYIQNLIDGNGFVYNTGEYVNGLTSPLFGYLSIIPAFILDDARDGIMTISVLFTFATQVIYYHLVNTLVSDNKFAAIFAWLAVCSTITYLNLGMESSLFTFMVGLCLFLYFREFHLILGICVGLLILARPEGVFLVPAMALNTFLYKRKWPPLSCYVIPTLLISIQLLFNYLYYDSFLSSSGMAKIYQGESGVWGENSYLLTLFTRFKFGLTVNGNWIVAAVLFVLAFCSLALKSARQFHIVSITFLVFYTLFFTIFNIPPQAWYYAIYYVLLWTYVALGLKWITQVLIPKYYLFVSYGSYFLILAMLIWQEPIMKSSHGSTVREDYKEFGIWLSQNTPEESSVAVVEIGTIGWYSKRRIIDILGLVTADVAIFIASGDFHSWVGLYQPDYILVHNPISGMEKGIQQLAESDSGSLTEVTSFNFPGFKLYQFLVDDVSRQPQLDIIT